MGVLMTTDINSWDYWWLMTIRGHSDIYGDIIHDYINPFEGNLGQWDSFGETNGWLFWLFFFQSAVEESMDDDLGQ